MTRALAWIVALVLTACSGSSATPGGGSGGNVAGPQDGRLFVRGVVNSTPGQCVAKAEADSQIQTQGRLDIAFGVSYQAVLLFGNQTASASDGGIDLARVTVSRADVSVTLADGAPIAAGSIPTSGFADSSLNGLPGYGLAQVTLLDAATAKAAFDSGQSTLATKTRLQGLTLGGAAFASDDFPFVIELCDGCLITYTGHEDATQPLPNCRAAMLDNTAPGYTTAPCAAGQDYPIDCVDCLDSVPRCLSRSP